MLNEDVLHEVRDMILLALTTVLHLLNRHPASLGDTLSQQGDLLRIRRPQLHLFAPQCPFDALDKLDIVLRDERYGLPGASGTGSTADAVDVVLRVCRYIVVDNDINVRNIQTTVWYLRSVSG